MKHLSRLLKMSRRLEHHSYALGHSYKCSINLLECDPNNIIHLTIENWSTWKGSFRLSDGMFIREGVNLDSKGISMARLYRQMLEELKAHAKRIRLFKDAEASNCIVFNNTLVVCENFDAKEWGYERVFQIFDDKGNFSRWYGRNAENALRNAAPFIRNLNPILIRLESEVPNETP